MFLLFLLRSFCFPIKTGKDGNWSWKKNFPPNCRFMYYEALLSIFIWKGLSSTNVSEMLAAWSTIRVRHETCSRKNRYLCHFMQFQFIREFHVHFAWLSQVSNDNFYFLFDIFSFPFLPLSVTTFGFSQLWAHFLYGKIRISDLRNTWNIRGSKILHFFVLKFVEVSAVNILNNFEGETLRRVYPITTNISI